MREHSDSRLDTLDYFLDHVLPADGQALLDDVVAELVTQKWVHTCSIVNHDVPHELFVYFVGVELEALFYDVRAELLL